MSQLGQQYRVKSLSTRDFTAALAAGAASVLTDLQLPAALKRQAVIRSIFILSVENLAWELNWFSGAAGVTASPDTDTWLGRWQFAAADAVQITGSSLYRYAIPEIVQPYRDLDGGTVENLHLMLVNREAVTGKTAGAGGAMTVWFNLEPTREV